MRLQKHRASLLCLSQCNYKLSLECSVYSSMFLFLLSFILSEAKLLYPEVTCECDLVMVEWHLWFQEDGSKVNCLLAGITI